MSSRAGVRAVVALVAVCLLLAGVAAAVPGGRTLVVADAATGDRLLTVPVEEGTTVALEYDHSVEKTRVLDGYAVRGDRLEMTRMEFESFGWGLPARADVRTENGTFVYDPPGNYTELYVTPGDVAGHRLHVGDRTYDLVALAGERSVRLHLVRRSALAAGIDALTG
jgi:hypothetical protein